MILSVVLSPNFAFPGSEDQIFSSSDCSLPDVAAHGPCLQKPVPEIGDNGSGTRAPVIGTNPPDVNVNLRPSRQDFLAPCAAAAAAAGGGGYGNHPFYHLSPCSVVGKSSYGRRQTASFCRADSISGGDLLPENKPRIWSLADVATSRSGSRGHSAAAGGDAHSPVTCSPSMGQNFQPWTSAGVYCDDGGGAVTSYPASPYGALTQFPVAMTHHQGAMGHMDTAEPGGQQLGGLLGNQMRQHRDHQMTLHYTNNVINGRYSEGNHASGVLFFLYSKTY